MFLAEKSGGTFDAPRGVRQVNGAPHGKRCAAGDNECTTSYGSLRVYCSNLYTVIDRQYVDQFTVFKF